MGATNCPETPRQKMITMMYLVYTAMLALNVSAEVLAGFKSVGTAMRKSNANIIAKLDDTYSNFESAYKNSPDKVGEQYNKAQQIKKLSKDLVGYLDSLECEFIGTKIVNKADIKRDTAATKASTVMFLDENMNVNHDSVRYVMDREGLNWFTDKQLEDNHNPANFFYLKPKDAAEGTKNKAEQIKEKIIAYNRAINQALGEYSAHVVLAMDVSDGPDKDGKMVSWEQLTFSEVITGAALVALTRIKAEALNAEFDAVNMLYKKVNKGDKSFSNIEMLSVPKAAYVMQGGTYETAIRVGAYDPNQRFRVMINGQSVTSDENGTANFKMTCNSVGPQTIKGKAIITTQDGEEEYDFSDEFYVAVPSATISLDNMNVLYAGLENPISVSAPGMASRDVSVTIDQNLGKLTKGDGEGKYNITPNGSVKAIEATVWGNIDGQQKKLNTIRYRVKEMPKPVLKVGVYENGEKKASRKEFSENTMVIASKSKDFEFKIPKGSIRIKTMNITVGSKTCAPIENSGKLNAEVASAIRKANRGDNLVVTATVMMPDGKPREVDCVIKLAK